MAARIFLRVITFACSAALLIPRPTITKFPITKKVNANKTDFIFSGVAKVEGTDAGTYEMELTSGDFTNTNTNFANVEFVIVDGTLEITKRNVTLTSATDSKVYDGEALENAEVTVSGDGFVEGEGARFDVTGSQTEVGTSKNTFTYELTTGTKASNYEITKTEGTLEVTVLERTITVTITENSGNAKYDGEMHAIKGYEYIKSLGYDEVYAGICIKHSFLNNDIN